MIWRNLVRQKCPQCGKDIKPIIQTDRMECVKCEFSIGNERYLEILGNISKHKESAMLEEFEEDQKNEDEYWKDPDMFGA